jgi:Ion channel
MWNVIITLTTTGYGDIYPKSDFGRFIGMIVCFWGTFVISFFVVTVNNMLTFEGSEEKSYTTLLRLHYKEKLKLYAANVLNSAFK